MRQRKAIASVKGIGIERERERVKRRGIERERELQKESMYIHKGSTLPSVSLNKSE